MSPKDSCIEFLGASLGHYWEVVAPLECQFSGRELGHWGHGLEGDQEILVPSCLCFQAAMRRADLPLCAPTMMFYFAIGPEEQDQMTTD